MAWLIKRTTADDLEKKYPKAVAELKARWAAAAEDDKPGSDEDEDEQVEPPPSSEPIAGETDPAATTPTAEPNEPNEPTTTGASVATGGAAGDDDDDEQEDPMAGSDSKSAPAATKAGTGASVAASIEDLEAKFPDQPAFVLECLRAKLSMSQAVEARNEQLEARVKQLEDEARARDEAESKMGARPAGSAPIGGAGGRSSAERGAATLSGKAPAKGAAAGVKAGGDPANPPTADRYLEKVAEVMVEKGCKRSEAIAIVNKEHPELRTAYSGGR